MTRIVLKERTTHTGIVSTLADCRDCDWVSEAKNALGNAAQHADKHGHEVNVEIVRVVTYNRKDRA